MDKYVFVKGALESVVWDPEKMKPLAEFSREGLFATRNRRVAKRLLKIGYRLKSDFPEGPPRHGFDPVETEEGKIDAGKPNVNIRVPRTETVELLKDSVSSDEGGGEFDDDELDKLDEDDFIEPDGGEDDEGKLKSKQVKKVKTKKRKKKNID